MNFISEGDERRLSFSDFAVRSSQVGNALRTMGIHKDERILIISPRLPEWWEAVLGIMKIGVIFMPGTTLLTAKDVAYGLQAAEAVAVITDAEGVQKLEEVANRQYQGLWYTISQSPLIEDGRCPC